MRILNLVCTALLLGAPVVGAQETVLRPAGLEMYGRSGSMPSVAGPAGGLLSFLQSPNFKLSNQTSFSVLSGSGGSLSQGVNVTRLTYANGGPMQMSVGLGTRFFSSGSVNGFQAPGRGVYLNDFRMQVRPGEHSLITVQYQSAPSLNFAPTRDGFGYGMRSVGFGYETNPAGR